MQHGKAIYEILNVQGEINIKLAKEISASEPPYILDGGEYGLLIKYSTTKKNSFSFSKSEISKLEKLRKIVTKTILTALVISESEICFIDDQQLIQLVGKDFTVNSFTAEKVTNSGYIVFNTKNKIKLPAKLKKLQ